MQGVWINGVRSKSKKALKEAIASNPESVRLEATSMFGNEYGGPLPSAPDDTFFVVGPCPHTKRNWYASIEKVGGTFKVK